jgi:hypothetical protein
VNAGPHHRNLRSTSTGTVCGDADSPSDLRSVHRRVSDGSAEAKRRNEKADLLEKKIAKLKFQKMKKR